MLHLAYPKSIISRVLHLGTCGSLPIGDLHLCLQAFNAARLLQLVVPTSTRFAAPLLTQPDLSREKSFASRSSSRLTAHTSHKVYYVNLRPHRCGNPARPLQWPFRAPFRARAPRLMTNAAINRNSTSGWSAFGSAEVRARCGPA